MTYKFMCWVSTAVRPGSPVAASRLPYRGFPSCRAWALGTWGSAVAPRRLRHSMTYGILKDQDRTWPPALAGGFWATGGGPSGGLLQVLASLGALQVLPLENICLECSSCPSRHGLSLAAQLKFHIFMLEPSLNIHQPLFEWPE